MSKENSATPTERVYMTMEEVYTVDKAATAEFTVKRSRFIANLCHVETAAAAKEFLLKQKKTYYDARHNPYAYVLGRRRSEKKSGDDGEPAGTAGSPILDAIEKNNLTDVIIVVTRYFGGIKLGAGGLTRAYNQGAVLGIQAAQLLKMTEKIPLRLTIDYSLFGTLEHWAGSRNIPIQNISYGEGVSLTLLMPSDTDFTREIIDLTAGRLKWEKLPPTIIFLPD